MGRMRIFYDTGCYRGIAKAANYDLAGIDLIIFKLKEKEKNLNYKPFLTYLVITELITRLENPATEHYLECKYGLYAAIKHIGYDKEKFVGSIETEIKNVIFNSNEVTVFEMSLFESASLLAKIISNNPNEIDEYIQENKFQFQQASKYLIDVKTNWINSFKNLPIPNDLGEKNEKRLALSGNKKSELVYVEFAIGMCYYAIKNTKEELFTDSLLIKLIIRFKPLFDMQFRIINFFYEQGYNLEKDSRANDITDYLIVGNINVEDTVFVTKDQKLFKHLEEFGYKNNVINYMEWIK